MTHDNINEIYTAKHQITQIESLIYGAIRSKNIEAINNYRNEIDRIKGRIKQKYEVIL